jgi:hypothetical protein
VVLLHRGVYYDLQVPVLEASPTSRVTIRLGKHHVQSREVWDIQSRMVQACRFVVGDQKDTMVSRGL